MDILNPELRILKYAEMHRLNLLEHLAIKNLIIINIISFN